MISATEKIKLHALDLGFSKVGIAKAELLTAEGKHLQEWLNRGYQGTMDWMARNFEKRIDIEKVLPNAKSVVCVAMNYYTSLQHSNTPESAKISRYAWGDDYHIVMTDRLEKLQDGIEEQIPGVHTKLYVDTGPVMDKVWAAKAGLGWQGKHTNLITKDFGSWVFLGEIILDTQLEYDEPIADFCGSCTACIEACPTQAITEPYVLDSNKCISYLTIEHKGDIPDSLKPKFENWVYGCDICQDVCPWNSFQQESAEKVFSPREFNVNPKLAELENLTDIEFREQTRRSPMKRTKYSGFMRNVKALLQDAKSTLR
ncbi:MAG: tRNA epoxyqueuosine(34) reductase QueG [Ignavibacteriales bacterium]|nr:tRNA epoxyqueuosine(34) reductase QueG [Ignavibacteriales bacterium]